jgi:hypothetical protein
MAVSRRPLSFMDPTRCVDIPPVIYGPWLSTQPVNITCTRGYGVLVGAVLAGADTVRSKPIPNCHSGWANTCYKCRFPCVHNFNMS